MNHRIDKFDKDCYLIFDILDNWISDYTNTNYKIELLIECIEDLKIRKVCEENNKNANN